MKKSALTQKEYSKLYNLFEKRVKKGVAFLDKQFGRQDWISRINLKNLDLNDSMTCVLGQTFPNNFWEGCEKLEEVYPGANEVDYGFNLDFSEMNIVDEYEKAEQEAWDLLSMIWAGKIKVYRKAFENPKIKKAKASYDLLVKKASSVI